MILSVIYQLQPGQKFDLDYYTKKHIPLVEERLKGQGLKSVQVLHGTGSPGGPPPVKLIALLEFDSLQAFQNGMEKHGAEIMGDVAKFTDTQPQIQFNDKLS
jgi:uncharacterized protein (TIGR02118 family)